MLNKLFSSLCSFFCSHNLAVCYCGHRVCDLGFCLLRQVSIKKGKNCTMWLLQLEAKCLVEFLMKYWLFQTVLFQSQMMMEHEASLIFSPSKLRIFNYMKHLISFLSF